MWRKSKIWLAVAALSALCVSVAPASGAPVKKDRFYYEQRGEIVWEVKTDQKIIALTFDDGPDPKQTPAILDLLKKYNAYSTFFVIGKKATDYPEIVRRIVEEGHELANHTYNHVYFKSSSSPKQIRQEITQAQDAIHKAANVKPSLFRPPGGMYTGAVVDAAKDMGLQMVMWSWHQDTRDWNLPGVQKIVKKVLGNARNGDIVLFHDHVVGRTQTIKALEIILPDLQKRGYRFETVSNLLKYSTSQPINK